MQTAIYILYILSCIVLMGFILMQRGRGGGGLAFGMGSTGSQSVFGATQADNLLRKVTKYSAGAFMISALILARMNSAGNKSVLDKLPATEESSAAAPSPNEAPPAGGEAEKPIEFKFTPTEAEGQPAPEVPADGAVPSSGPGAPVPATAQPAPTGAAPTQPAPAEEAPKPVP